MYDCDCFLVISTGWCVIMIVSWAIGELLSLFESYSGWGYDYDSFLVISNGWLVIVIVSWAIENNLVYFLGLFWLGL